MYALLPMGQKDQFDTIRTIFVGIFIYLFIYLFIPIFIQANKLRKAVFQLGRM